MSFKKPLPTWKSQGIQPPEHKLEEGWKAQDKPPAGWLNWQANTTYEALQELQDNAVDHRDVTSEPSANGVVRLNEAGKLNEAVLAGAEHKEITLKPGVQIVESEQDTPFNFGSVQGRTLINLLGRKGGCESLSDVQYPANSSAIELDASNKTGGMSGIKVTSISNQAYGVFIDIPIDNTKHYIAMADIKNGTSVSATLRACKTDYTVINSSALSASKSFQTLYIALKTTDLTGIQTLRLYARFKEGVAGEVGNVDSFRIYEISQTEYDAIATMTPEQVAAKYPYVDSMTNVTNPYAIATGDNLLPPFYEWADTAQLTVPTSGEYEITLNKNSSNDFATKAVDVSLPPNVVFTFSSDVDANFTESGMFGTYTNVFNIDSNGNLTSIDLKTTSYRNESGTFTIFSDFTVPQDSKVIRLLIGVDAVSTGKFVFKNPMLTEGTKVKPFKPQQRSMWAAECQLAANPVDGTSADVLFMGDDGLPYVLEKWGKEVLAEKQQWGIVATYTGFKQLGGQAYGYPITGHQGFVVKYDGKLLANFAGVPSSADMGTISQNSGEIHITISNTDSGWGDNYTPTADEIKAYFLGWKMTIQGSSTGVEPYNNSGTKVWVNIMSWDGNKYYMPGATPTLPTIVSDRAYKPYRLQYLKATPTVESIRNYEQGLTLCSGSNVIEVGSGIVNREKANPFHWRDGGDGNHHVSRADINAPSNLLCHKGMKVIDVLVDNKKDGKWATVYDQYGYGDFRLICAPQNYDPTAVYYVTYTMLDPTLSAPINGNVAMNLRGVVSDLAQHTGDIERRLSVVENHKADEESPQWIAPTMLNGSASHDASPAMYKKWNGLVFLKGLFTTTSSTVIFKLPIGYRPNKSVILNIFSVTSGNLTPSNLEIKPDGDVRVGFHGTDYSSLDGIIFEAEQ